MLSMPALSTQQITRQPEIHTETLINKTKNPQKSRTQSSVLEGKQNCQNKLGVCVGSSWAHSEMGEDITHNRSSGPQGMTTATAVLQNRTPMQMVYCS